jgi:FkbM family methyltransferase
MQKLKSIAQSFKKRFKRTFGLHYAPIKFAGHVLTLDTIFSHECAYLNYIKRGEVTGSIGMDVWVFSHFVKPGSIVLDAGANIGFTAVLAEKNGAAEIHSFEPNPHLIERLKKHCQGGKIFVYAKALGEKPGSVRLCLSTQHNQGSTLSDRLVKKFPQVFKGSEFVRVDVETIDRIFGSKHFDLFKIDVEGSEVETLRGASLLLKSSPPGIIYIEAYEDFFEDIHDVLNEYYKFTYRIVCDRNGRCRLFPLDADISRMEKENIYVAPPSYIYSLSAQEELASRWT